jgi:hypothetical protein
VSASEYAEIAERFRKDTADHEMTVLHDDGLYRHLRFKAPRRGAYWFDLVTWPGALTITGDVEGYTFRRIEDMFQFFRMHRTPRDGQLDINPHYWSGKVEGRSDITKTYSAERFKQQVIEDFKDTVKYGDVPRGLGRAIREEILNNPDIGSEYTARKLIEDFGHGELFEAECLMCSEKSGEHHDRKSAEHWERMHRRATPKHLCHISTRPAFTFYDTWEWDLQDYDWTFLWCCHAIVWGIGQYDAARTPEAVAS